ncbi:MAG: hypothetical protein V2A76_16595 [Planctomycetota bacterium]
MSPVLEKGQVDEHAFLGREFLTWLWWQAEAKGGVYAVTDTERIGITLDRVLEFLDEATGVRVVVRGDAPTRAPEAREALSRGMHLKRAGLILAVGGENISLVLDGETFDLRSVKGERPEGESREERDASALASLFGLVDALDRVYATFLKDRISPRFRAETGPSLLDWARSASQGRQRHGRRGDEPLESAAV